MPTLLSNPQVSKLQTLQSIEESSQYTSLLNEQSLPCRIQLLRHELGLPGRPLSDLNRFDRGHSQWSTPSTPEHSPPSTWSPTVDRPRQVTLRPPQRSNWAAAEIAFDGGTSPPAAPSGDETDDGRRSPWAEGPLGGEKTGKTSLWLLFCMPGWDSHRLFVCRRIWLRLRPSSCGALAQVLPDLSQLSSGGLV